MKLVSVPTPHVAVFACENCGKIKIVLIEYVGDKFKPIQAPVCDHANINTQVFRDLKSIGL